MQYVYDPFMSEKEFKALCEGAEDASKEFPETELGYWLAGVFDPKSEVLSEEETNAALQKIF
jgi:hypothetical protein